MSLDDNRRVNPKAWALLGAGGLVCSLALLLPKPRGSELSGAVNALALSFVALGLIACGLALVLLGAVLLVKHRDAIFGRAVSALAVLATLATLGVHGRETLSTGPRHLPAAPAACRGSPVAASHGSESTRIGSGAQRLQMAVTLADGRQVTVTSGTSIHLPRAVVTLGEIQGAPRRRQLIVQSRTSSAMRDVTKSLGGLVGLLDQAVWLHGSELLLRTRGGWMARATTDLNHLVVLQPPRALVAPGAYAPADPIVLEDEVLLWSADLGELFSLSLADNSWRASAADRRARGLWSTAATRGSLLCLAFGGGQWMAFTRDLEPARLGPMLGGRDAVVLVGLLAYLALVLWLFRVGLAKRAAQDVRGADAHWIRAGLLSLIAAGIVALLALA